MGGDYTDARYGAVFISEEFVYFDTIYCLIPDGVVFSKISNSSICCLDLFVRQFPDTSTRWKIKPFPNKAN